LARKSIPTYCIATFYFKEPYMGVDQVMDESAILHSFDMNKLEIVSAKYQIGKDMLSNVSMSIVDGNNSYLIVSGNVIATEITEQGILYTIETPQKHTKTLPNGQVLELECVSLTKYCNIHKPKRKPRSEYEKLAKEAEKAEEVVVLND